MFRYDGKPAHQRFMVNGEFTKEFQQYFDDVGQYGCDNYCDNEVAEAMLSGMHPAEAADWINGLRAEDPGDFCDFEDRQNRDFSMNG